MKGVLPAGVQKLNRFARAVFRNGEERRNDNKKILQILCRQKWTVVLPSTLYGRTKIGQVLLMLMKFKGGLNPISKSMMTTTKG